MVSPHLEAERDRLLQLIQTIRDSGSVAPINVWASPAQGEHAYYNYQIQLLQRLRKVLI